METPLNEFSWNEQFNVEQIYGMCRQESTHIIIAEIEVSLTFSKIFGIYNHFCLIQYSRQ